MQEDLNDRVRVYYRDDGQIAVAIRQSDHWQWIIGEPQDWIDLAVRLVDEKAAVSLIVPGAHGGIYFERGAVPDHALEPDSYQRYLDMQEDASSCGRFNHCEHVIPKLTREEFELAQAKKKENGAYTVWVSRSNYETHRCCKCEDVCIWDCWADEVWKAREENA